MTITNVDQNDDGVDVHFTYYLVMALLRMQIMSSEQRHTYTMTFCQLAFLTKKRFMFTSVQMVLDVTTQM